MPNKRQVSLETKHQVHQTKTKWEFHAFVEVQLVTSVQGVAHNEYNVYTYAYCTSCIVYRVFPNNLACTLALLSLFCINVVVCKQILPLLS